MMKRGNTAMPILLHIDSSPMGEDSISRCLTAEFVRRWRCANSEGKVLSRELAAMDIPVIDAAWVAANLTPADARTPEQNEILGLSTRLTRDLLDADEYVFGIPMHNWGPSSSFKLWADQVVRFGETVKFHSSGPKGALVSKRATFFLTAGRRYNSASADAPINHLEPWLRTFFGNLGVTDMRFTFVDGTADVKYGKADRVTFLAPHLAAVRSLFPRALRGKGRTRAPWHRSANTTVSR
jgi:FMN-dependent NADH-azoreductase